MAFAKDGQHHHGDKSPKIIWNSELAFEGFCRAYAAHLNMCRKKPETFDHLPVRYDLHPDNSVHSSCVWCGSKIKVFNSEEVSIK